MQSLFPHNSNDCYTGTPANIQTMRFSVQFPAQKIIILYK